MSLSFPTIRGEAQGAKKAGERAAVRGAHWAAWRNATPKRLVKKLVADGQIESIGRGDESKRSGVSVVGTSYDAPH